MATQCVRQSGRCVAYCRYGQTGILAAGSRGGRGWGAGPRFGTKQRSKYTYPAISQNRRPATIFAMQWRSVKAVDQRLRQPHDAEATQDCGLFKPVNVHEIQLRCHQTVMSVANKLLAPSAVETFGNLSLFIDVYSAKGQERHVCYERGEVATSVALSRL